MDIKIEGFSTEHTEYYQYTLDLRSKIFVQEMGYDKHLEFDGKDNEAMHYILLYDLKPAGCARWMENEKEIIVDRFGIEQSYRKRGLAMVLLRFIVSELLPSGKEIKILCPFDTIVFFTQSSFRDTGASLPFGNKQLRILTFSNG